MSGPTRLGPEALVLLQEGEYPGNARQLHGVVVYAYAMAAAAGAGEIAAEHLPEGLCRPLRYKRRSRCREGARTMLITVGSHVFRWRSWRSGQTRSPRTHRPTGQQRPVRQN